MLDRWCLNLKRDVISPQARSGYLSWGEIKWNRVVSFEAAPLLTSYMIFCSSIPHIWLCISQQKLSWKHWAATQHKYWASPAGSLLVPMNAWDYTGQKWPIDSKDDPENKTGSLAERRTLQGNQDKCVQWCWFQPRRLERVLKGLGNASPLVHSIAKSVQIQYRQHYSD